MENTLLFVIIACSVVAGVIILAFIIGCISYRQHIGNLYKNETRDERFAGALLSQIFGEQILKKPYVLRDDSVLSPKVDAIYVCSGGLAVISVQEGGGLFSAPEQGGWRVIENGEMRLIDNLLERQQVYVSEISATLMKHSLRCPVIRGYVFVTDDHAEIDYMSASSVVTGSQLIEELKDFDAQKKLKAGEQRAILEALQKNHKNIRQTYLYRSQRDIAIPDPSKERDEAPEEEEFDFSGLILVSDNDSDDAPPAETSTTTKVRILTENENSDDNDGEENE